MKFCKKMIVTILVLTMLVIPVQGLFAAYAETDYPELPEGYDGYVTMTVEAFTVGWGYVIEPTFVPYIEGETIAQVTIRLFETLNVDYFAGDGESFYLTDVECACIENGTEPAVPEYLMDQLELYPQWSEENFGYVMGSWTGIENGSGMLGEFDYSDFAGWMIAEEDELTPGAADAMLVQQNHVYRWMFSIYGYGMDIGMGDGWGMFPEFTNPALGVLRSDASRMYASVCSDVSLAAMIQQGGVAYDEFCTFKAALETIDSDQVTIDTAMQALTAALETTPLMGDVDGDGNLTVADAIMIMRHALSVIQLDEAQLAVADCNGNGSVEVADALAVARITLGV